MSEWSHSRNCERVVIQGYAGYDEFSLPRKKSLFTGETDIFRLFPEFFTPEQKMPVVV